MYIIIFLSLFIQQKSEKRIGLRIGKHHIVVGILKTSKIVFGVFFLCLNVDWPSIFKKAENGGAYDEAKPQGVSYSA